MSDLLGVSARTTGSWGVGLRLLLMLAAQVVLVGVVRRPVDVAVAAVLVGVAYGLCGVGPRRAWAALRGILLVALLVGGLQVLVLPWGRAVVVAGVMVLAVALAALVTLTTSTSDLLDALERGLAPARRVGVDPERVALLLALTVRTLPVIAGFGARLREASRARGVRTGPVAYAVALVVLTVQHAERVGEALTARGLDD